VSAEHTRHHEEEVLLAFSVEHTHDHATLERYLSHYPEHAQALVDCSIELMMNASLVDEDVEFSTDQLVEQAWRQFQAAMSSVQSSVNPNPFTQLQPAAFKSIASKLGINKLLLIRVHERAIDATTIPRRFVQQLAAELGVTADAVSNYLRSPPIMAPNLSFRSNVKPEVAAQITFDQAIETSQLTPTQKEALQALQD
jgi:hypothetical protein